MSVYRCVVYIVVQVGAVKEQVDECVQVCSGWVQ